MGWFSDFVGFESGNKNVTNVNQSTSSGRARGYFQITDGTWNDFARKAGVDLAQYPTALSAPYHLQLAVAKNIPLKRWDPITLRRMSAKGHRFDVNKTLGENMAANGETGLAGNPGAPLPAAAAVVTGAGQPKLDYASPEKLIPGATQPNVGPGSDHTGESLASAFAGAAGGGGMPEIGGGGGGGGGGMPDAGFGNLSLSSDSAAPRGGEIGGPELSQLAEVFQLPMIGQVSKLKPFPATPEGWI
jgi:hypothetical protein